MGGRSRWKGKDKLWDSLRSGGMMGSLVFWAAIWAFTGFSGGLFPIFLGIALLTGWQWEQRKRKGEDPLDDLWDDDDDDDDDDWGMRDDDDDDLWETRKRRRRSTSQPLGQGAGHPADPVVEEPPPRAAGNQSQAIHMKVIADAQPALTRIKTAAGVATGGLGEQLRRIAATADQIARALEADPARLAEVQRAFTYYLPSAADLIGARGGLVASGDTARVAEIDTMIGRLDAAFTDFLAKMQGQDARAIDIDIRLLEQSLDQEFAGRRKP